LPKERASASANAFSPESIDLIRRARLGALRLPTQAGGAGSTIRELFEVVIRLGEADANVAHILRNHFSVTPAQTRWRSWLSLDSSLRYLG